MRAGRQAGRQAGRRKRLRGSAKEDSVRSLYYELQRFGEIEPYDEMVLAVAWISASAA